MWDSRLRGPAGPYFNFTNSKTKIAHTPTVIGNCTSAALRTGPPPGSAYVRAIIANAVRIPTSSLLQLMCLTSDLRFAPPVLRRDNVAIFARKYTLGESASRFEFIRFLCVSLVSFVVHQDTVASIDTPC